MTVYGLLKRFNMSDCKTFVHLLTIALNDLESEILEPKTPYQ